MSVYEQVFDALKEANIDVYPPGIYEGECKDNYVVLRDGGSSPIASFSSQYVFYDMLCYVPAKRYTDLYDFVDKCKKAMEKIYPVLMPTGTETQSFYDDTKKSHMISVEYRNARRAQKII
jgi:hypothetical protein